MEGFGNRVVGEWLPQLNVHAYTSCILGARGLHYAAVHSVCDGQASMQAEHITEMSNLLQNVRLVSSGLMLRLGTANAKCLHSP